MKLTEFTTMLLAAERFQRDAKLSSLTRKDKNQLSQQAEDAQFFRILLRMMLEVSRLVFLTQAGLVTTNAPKLRAIMGLKGKSSPELP